MGGRGGLGGGEDRGGGEDLGEGGVVQSRAVDEDKSIVGRR
jgi:hypothetical protein